MSFLVSLCSQLIIWIIEKAGAALAALVQKLVREKKIEDEAKESVEPLKKATTPDEIDKAADSALNGT